LRVGRLIAVAAIAVVVAVLLSSAPAVVRETPFGSGSSPTPGPVLFPVLAPGSAATDATRSLVIVPAPSGTASGCVHGTVGNPYPESTEGYLSFNGNLFDLPAGSVGSTSLCYDAATKILSDGTSFISLPGAPANGVLGYPEAMLGENLYGGPAGSSNSVLPLPDDKVSQLKTAGLWVIMHYGVSAPGKSPYDFAFDDWLTPVASTPTSSGNEGDRVEIMIWLSNDIGMYLAQTKVPIPTYLNGSAAPGTWYRDQRCLGTNDVTFDYLFAPTGAKPGYGLTSARIAFDLSYILNNVASVVRGGVCWASAGTHIDPMYADVFPLGAEFYPTKSLTSNVSWGVSSLCYQFRDGAVPASGPSC
jgi:hypothetical protein